MVNGEEKQLFNEIGEKIGRVITSQEFMLLEMRELKSNVKKLQSEIIPRKTLFQIIRLEREKHESEYHDMEKQVGRALVSKNGFIYKIRYPILVGISVLLSIFGIRITF